jgi:hypothetical protein
MPVLKKCNQQLDTIGKILQAFKHNTWFDHPPLPSQANVSPKQSPIDLIPAITAFDPALDNAIFKYDFKKYSAAIIENYYSTDLIMMKLVNYWSKTLAHLVVLASVGLACLLKHNQGNRWSAALFYLINNSN